MQTFITLLGAHNILVQKGKNLFIFNSSTLCSSVNISKRIKKQVLN